MIIENDKRFKECPFCKGHKFSLIRGQDDHEYFDVIWIRCKCGATGREYTYGCEPDEYDLDKLDGSLKECFEMAIRDWNDRKNIRREFLWGEKDVSYNAEEFKGS